MIAGPVTEVGTAASEMLEELDWALNAEGISPVFVP